MTLTGEWLSLMAFEIIVQVLQFALLIIILSSMERDHLSVKKVVKNLQN